MATTAGSAINAAVYFVDAARPHSRPVPATRRRVAPRVRHLAAAQNAQTVTNVTGTSVTPKCESLTWRNATARNAAAASAARVENSSRPAAYSAAIVADSGRRRQRARNQMDEDRVGRRGRDEVRERAAGADGALHDELQRVAGGRQVNEEAGVEKEMRIQIPVQHAERRTGDSLLVRPRQVVRQTKPQARQTQDDSHSDDHAEQREPCSPREQSRVVCAGNDLENIFMSNGSSTIYFIINTLRRH